MASTRTQTEQKFLGQTKEENEAMLKGVAIGAVGMFAALAWIGRRSIKLRSRQIDAEYKKLCEES